MAAPSIDQLQTETLYLFICTLAYVPRDQYGLSRHCS